MGHLGDGLSARSGRRSGAAERIEGRRPGLVGMTGFEPATSRSQSGRSTKLSYIPWAHTAPHRPSVSEHAVGEDAVQYRMVARATGFAARLTMTARM